MRLVRVKGLVGEANRVRQALTSPMTCGQREALAQSRERSLRQIDAILARHRASPRHLPAPSRRAYEFLKHVDLDRIELVEEAAATRDTAVPAESVTYRGLRAFLDCLLDDVALTLDGGRFNETATLGVIRRTADRLDHAMRRDGLGAEHLKPESRQLAGWFRYFALEETFRRYAEAVGRAQAVLGPLPATRAGWRRPLLVHYRPSSHLYRWRLVGDGTRIILVTPMITFDEKTLEHLGRQMLGHEGRGPVITAAMMADAYQAVAVELEAAAGAVERTRGIAHDLAEVFNRVNGEYFDGELARPRLSWTRTLTGTTFGHYDFVRDRLCLSSTLDHANVPEFVVDHVMHHELLHKKHGFQWQGSRQHTHTRAFRAEEKAFPGYAKAAQFLNELSASPGRMPRSPERV